MTVFQLGPMLDIMIRFRCHEVGMMFDLTKAYNSLHTGTVEVICLQL